MNSLLRFNTCGSVDDGKSTLIGRLLYDAKALLEDQLASLSAPGSDAAPDLARLTDGLRAEREQGITIDVAYRYFATPRRRFIVADTPGHAQYTRNMVTGASTANLSVVLVDARQGATEQTRRHLGIAALLRVPHLLVAVNKLDLVDWSRARFDEIREEIEGYLPRLGLRDVVFLPISARHGDNVVEPSAHTPWHTGPTLLRHLENVHIASDPSLRGFRLPVQWVNRPHRPDDPRLHDFRGLSGQIAGGRVRVGDRLVVLPAGLETTVRALHAPNGPVEEAFCPQSITVELADDLDVGRGDVLVGVDEPPFVAQTAEADLCWMQPKPLRAGARLLVKHGTRLTPAAVTALESRLDLTTFESRLSPEELVLNDLGRIRLRTAQPLVFDAYEANRATGGFILIDPVSNATVAAGMLRPAAERARWGDVDFAI